MRQAAISQFAVATPLPVRIDWGGSKDGFQVPVDVASQHLGDLAVGLEVEIFAGGEYHLAKVGGPTNALATAAHMPVKLDLASLLTGLDDDAFTVSGQILVYAIVEYADGAREKIASEPRYFHRLPSGRYAIYDAATRDTTHGGGNFRGAHALPPDPDRMGFIDGGQGMPPELVAEILVQDPAGPIVEEG